MTAASTSGVAVGCEPGISCASIRNELHPKEVVRRLLSAVCYDGVLDDDNNEN